MLKIGFISFAGVASLVLIAAFAMSIYAVVELQKVNARHLYDQPLVLSSNTQRTGKVFDTVYTGDDGKLSFHGDFKLLSQNKLLVRGFSTDATAPNQQVAEAHVDIVLEALEDINDVQFKFTWNKGKGVTKTFVNPPKLLFGVHSSSGRHSIQSKLFSDLFIERISSRR